MTHVLDASGKLKVPTGAGGGSNALLDGSVHNDTLAGVVAAGDVIIGNATPKWARLAIGALNWVLKVTGAGTVAWGQVDHGELTGVTADQHHAQAHHAEHEPAGGDAMAADAAAATASLRTLGTGAAQAAAGNHAHSLSNSTNKRASDVALTNANQYYDGPSLTLGAGTWLLIGAVSFKSVTAIGDVTVKLWDGATVFASGCGRRSPFSFPSASAALSVDYGAASGELPRHRARLYRP